MPSDLSALGRRSTSMFTCVSARHWSGTGPSTLEPGIMEKSQSLCPLSLWSWYFVLVLFPLSLLPMYFACSLCPCLCFACPSLLGVSASSFPPLLHHRLLSSHFGFFCCWPLCSSVHPLLITVLASSTQRRTHGLGTSLVACVLFVGLFICTRTTFLRTHVRSHFSPHS